ncbi:MAG: DNA polymerase IV [Ruminococcaceae bacterium]|nr:DNA polymerase IV [Oscillospiraceae bacterium]
MERIILHCDMNNFYASVECRRDPSLRGKPVAVCGSVEERRGIVLAKNELAKACGVTTGETVGSAKYKCPQLVTVSPHFDLYAAASRQAREIYGRFTEQVEPFGMDECWLDVTASTALFGDGVTIADTLRQTIKEELGLTISVGVSFNKIFAKLGSDLKKPDATTYIPRETFREQLWGLPAASLLGVGKATAEQLRRCGIHTIGQLAKADARSLRYQLKSRADQLIAYANGQDNDPVKTCDMKVPAKSVGHGITTLRDLVCNDEVWPVALELTQEIGHRLRVYGQKAGGVSIAVRDNDLRVRQWQKTLDSPTFSPFVLAKEAFALFAASYDWKRPIRAVTVTAINLSDAAIPTQLQLWEDTAHSERQEKLDSTVELLRQRFGAGAVRNAVLYGESLIPPEEEYCALPTNADRE